jgi:hypothetical protein
MDAKGDAYVGGGHQWSREGGKLQKSAPSAQPSDGERTREVWWHVGAREDKDGRRLSRDGPRKT